MGFPGDGGVGLTLWALLSLTRPFGYLSCPFLFLIFAPREDLGFRFISEQVSHHPPISAFYSEGLHQDFLFHGSIYPKLKFWGKSVEAEPRGTITLELLK